MPLTDLVEFYEDLADEAEKINEQQRKEANRHG
jgi:hypothetical protein